MNQTTHTTLFKLFASLLVMLLILPSPFADVHAAKTEKVPVDVFVKEDNLSFSLPPFLLNHTTMAPIRPVAEALGAKITWNKQTKTVTAVRSNQKITFQAGSALAYINGKTVKLKSPIELVNGMAIVPVRVLAEAFQQKVAWIPSIQAVQILDQKQISILEAEKRVRQHVKPSSSTLVEFDHAEENGEVYVIHVYNQIQTKEEAHTATLGWYYVHSYTGKIESMF